MNRICIEKSTGKLIEFQSGKADLGTLIQNAINAGYDENDIEEKYTDDDYQAALLKHETIEEKNKREEKEAKLIAVNDAKKIIADKYKGKKKEDIPDADVMEWMKSIMAQELGL